MERMRVKDVFILFNELGRETFAENQYIGQPIAGDSHQFRWKLPFARVLATFV